MRPIQLKISDLATVAGYTRFQMRGLLKEFLPKPARGKQAGTQRTFSSRELLLIIVACELEQKYGVKRTLLAAACDAMRDALMVPRTADRNARLLVTFVPPTATYLLADAAVSEGLIVRLGPLLGKVDEYLGVSGPGPDSAQAVLPLRPAIATGRRNRSSRNR